MNWKETGRNGKKREKGEETGINKKKQEETGGKRKRNNGNKREKPEAYSSLI